MRNMCRISKARIVIDRNDDQRADGRKTVEISGSHSAVSIAKVSSFVPLRYLCSLGSFANNHI